MSILFFILKFIGILILIPIVLLLILLIFPICYQLEGDFDGKKPEVKANVSWAIVFLRAKAFYQDGIDFGIRIFGIPIYDSRKEHWSVFGEHKEKKKKKRKSSKKKTKERKEHIKQAKEKNSDIHRTDKKEIKGIKEEKTEEIKKKSEDVLDLPWNEKEVETSKKPNAIQDTEKESKQGQKEKEFFGKKIVNILKKCYNKCKSLFQKIGAIIEKMETIGDLFSDEDIIDAVKRIKDYGVNGVKLLLPQKLNAEITFGFEDPYYTGRALAWAALLIPIYGEHLDITPDFEKKILKGHIKIKGSVRRYKILLLLWKIYKDKDDLLKQKDRALTMIGGN